MNIKRNIQIITTVLMIGFSAGASAQATRLSPQQADAQRQRSERSYYRKTLGVDSVRAEQVAKVQEEYKKSLKLVMADTTLNEAAKRVRIKAIIQAKNQRYENLLSLAQQAKIIPSTEREAPKGKQP